jgi:sugar phosphate isomerase/epimerase
MVFGLSSFTYGWSLGANGSKALLDVFDLIQLTSRFGLHCLQIGDNAPIHSLDNEKLMMLKQAAHEHRIRLEVGARGLTEEHLDRYIGITSSLESPLLRFVIDGPGYEPDHAEIIAIIRNSLPSLKQNKITLGIENHDRFKAVDLKDIIDTLGDENVGICLDTVNSLGAGEGLEWVAKVLAPYTVNLHIKDFSIKRYPHNMGFNVTGTPAGDGMMNIPEILMILKKYNRCHSAVLEQWVPWGESHGDTVALEKVWAEQSISYLKELSFFER